MDNPESNQDGHSKYTEKYIDLLDKYTSNIKEVNETRTKLKKRFFTITMSVLIGIAVCFVLSVFITLGIFYKLSLKNAVFVEVVITASVSIISSLLTFVIALIKLPKIIAKYLFNPNEDEHMSNIIKNIQDYEFRMENIERGSEKRLMSDKENNEDNEDIVVSEIPNPPVPEDGTKNTDKTNNEDNEEKSLENSKTEHIDTKNTN